MSRRSLPAALLALAVMAGALPAHAAAWSVVNVSMRTTNQAEEASKKAVASGR